MLQSRRIARLHGAGLVPGLSAWRGDRYRNLIDCVQMRELSYGLDGQPVGIIGQYTNMLTDRPNEREFGEYSVGRYAWILSGVQCFEKPIPATGALGLWEWKPAAEQQAPPSACESVERGK
jgi:hypothetical protein